MAEILATLEDINSHLPSVDDPGGMSGLVVEATDDNTGLLQVSFARVVRGYLSRAVAPEVLMGWNNPANTPDIIREAASLFIAAQVYFNAASRSTTTVEDNHYAQRLYDRAMAILEKILAGEIDIGADIVVETPALSELDFHPVDDTDRAFSMGMQL